MSKEKPYTVVWEDNPEALIESVNKLIEKGYELYGDLHVVTEVRTYYGKLYPHHTTTFYREMIDPAKWALMG